MGGREEGPRHRVVTGPADILPALAGLSLVGLLLSRAQLRFTKQRVVYGRSSWNNTSASYATFGYG